MSTAEERLRAIASAHSLDENLTPGQRAMWVQQFCTRIANGRHPGSSPPPTLEEAAKIAGVNKTTVSDAKLIASHGTPEQIEAAKNGAVGLGPLADKVRAGLPPKLPRAIERAEKRQKYRVGRFEKVIQHLADTCEQTTDLEIPSLSSEEMYRAFKELQNAAKSISALRRRISNGRR